VLHIAVEIEALIDETVTVVVDLVTDLLSPLGDHTSILAAVL